MLGGQDGGGQSKLCVKVTKRTLLCLCLGFIYLGSTLSKATMGTRANHNRTCTVL